MITAVDSSVLFDVLTDDLKHGARSLAALRQARQLGRLVVCPVVWAEVRSFFSEPATMGKAFAAAGISFDPFDQECSDLAGQAWAGYRRQGGPRTRIMSDFLIGAHAQTRGARLLAGNRGFFRSHFRSLEVIDPSA